MLTGRIVERGGCFTTTVDYCGVIAVAEQVADGLKRKLSVLTEEVHGYVASFSDRLDTARSGEGLGGYVEVAGDSLDDGFRARW